MRARNKHFLKLKLTSQIEDTFPIGHNLSKSFLH